MIISTQGSINSGRKVSYFIAKRISRVLPPYFIATIIYILCVYGVDYFSNYQNIISFLRSMTFLPVSYEPYFNASLPVGWTLNFEIYFYIIFGCSLFFKKYNFFVLCLFIYITVYLIPMKIGDFTMDPLMFRDYSFAYYNIISSPFIFEFLCGSFSAYIYLYMKKKNINFKLTSVLFIFLFFSLLIVFLFYWVCEHNKFYSHGLLNWGMISLVFFNIIILLDYIFKFRIPYFLIIIGDISYTLYITHFTTLFMINQFINKYELNYINNTIYYVFFSSFICIVVSFLLYNPLEKMPSNYMRNKLCRLLDLTNHYFRN